MADLKNKNIVLAICGGIAIYKVCELIRKLVISGANVSCIMTSGAMKFITPLTFQTLSKNKVYYDMFDTSSWEIGHISLSERADILAVVPATANTIAKLAAGQADNLLCSTVLASKSKIMICPAMNSNMFHHKATRNNLKTLQSHGYKIVMPECGELACGIQGDGRLAKTDVIFEKIVSEIN